MTKISGEFQISEQFCNFKNFRTAGSPAIISYHTLAALGPSQIPLLHEFVFHDISTPWGKGVLCHPVCRSDITFVTAYHYGMHIQSANPTELYKLTT